MKTAEQKTVHPVSACTYIIYTAERVALQLHKSVQHIYAVEKKKQIVANSEQEQIVTVCIYNYCMEHV